nr:hypothetical protein [Phyllobacterium sp. IY22]
MKQPRYPLDRAGKADTGNPDNAWSAQAHGPPLLHLVSDFLAVFDLISDRGYVGLDVADFIDDLIHTMNDRTLLISLGVSLTISEYEEKHG